jgi:23S rRNA pseudouridine1911/1915/1917 synthase
LSTTSLTYIAELSDQNTFLRDLLAAKFSLSHSLTVKLKQQHKIKVNDRVCRTNYLVQPGDRVSIDLALVEENEIIPEALPLDIIYEDADFLAVNKPAGMAIHPAKRNGRGTLANAVTYYWQQAGQRIRFRPINRLDKDTSGLILIGNSQFAHQSLFEQLKRDRFKRYYLALVEGVLPEDAGTIDQPIALESAEGRKRIIRPDGKKAVTHYQVLSRSATCTWLLLRLETGRTHQIRVHLSHLGQPICGDVLYGRDSPWVSRQALHASILRFVHPRTKAEVTLYAPLPADFQNALHQSGFFIQSEGTVLLLPSYSGI